MVDGGLLASQAANFHTLCVSCLRRWQAAMEPVPDALDSLSKATIEQQPSTAYQRAFHAGVAPRIQKACAAFRKAASKGFSSASEAQGILEQITAAVEQQCRSACHSFTWQPHGILQQHLTACRPSISCWHVAMRRPACRHTSPPTCGTMAVQCLTDGLSAGLLTSSWRTSVLVWHRWKTQLSR